MNPTVKPANAESASPMWLKEVSDANEAQAFYTPRQWSELIALLKLIHKAFECGFEVAHPEDLARVTTAIETIRTVRAELLRNSMHEVVDDLLDTWSRSILDLEFGLHRLHSLCGRRRLQVRLKVELIALLDVLTRERVETAHPRQWRQGRGGMRIRHAWAAIFWGAATEQGGSVNAESMKKFASKHQADIREMRRVSVAARTRTSIQTPFQVLAQHHRLAPLSRVR